MITIGLILLIIALVLVAVDLVLGFAGIGPPSLLTKVALLLTIIAVMTGA